MSDIILVRGWAESHARSMAHADDNGVNPLTAGFLFPADFYKGVIIWTGRRRSKPFFQSSDRTPFRLCVASICCMTSVEAMTSTSKKLMIYATR